MISSESAVRRSPDGNEGNDPAVRLLAAITSAQKKALGKHDAGEIFEAMLEETLALTASAFGFMGEVLHSPEDKPFLKTHALTNISWNTETQALYEQHLAQELEFTNLDTLFGAALRTGDPVISNKPAHDPRRGGLPTGHPPIESFLGLPVYEEDRMIGLIGLANRPGGYDQEIIAFLAPLLTTCATLITFFRNDEARIGAENGLRKSLRNWEQTFQAIGDLALILAPDQTILHANQTTVDHTGLPSEELLGRKCYEVFHGTKQAPDDCPFTQMAVSGEHTTGSMEVQSLQRTYLVSCTPQFDEAENILRVIHVATDITKIKKAEKELAESEDRYRDLVESSSDLVCTHGLDGRLLSFNPVPAQLLGYSQDTLLQMNLRDVLAPETRDQFERYLQRIKTHHAAQGLMVVQTATGERRIWEYNNTLRTQGVREPIVRGMARDVTEQKKAEKALRESEKHNVFQAKLLWSAPVIAAFHDTEHNIVWANRAYEQATGQSLQDMEGKKCYSVWGLTKRCRNCTVVNALATGKTCEAELTPQTQDHWPESRGYWLSRATPVTDDAGNTIGAMETATDIRALKQAEMERERFRAAINQAEDMIMITDREGTIEYVNPAFERITGYTAAEAIGENPRILKSGVQDDAFYRDFWETICSGNTFQGRMVNKGKGGALHTEEVMVSPVYDPAGGIVNFVAIKRDITEHLRISAQLQQAQKLEAIGTLAAGIAHDFNNILSVILGYSEAARAEVGEDSKAGGDLQHVIKAADRAVDLVDQILAVSRQSEQEREPIAIQHIIKETLELLRPSISSLIEIRSNIDPECPEVFASLTEIHQVIMNLCTNAYQAMQNSDAGNHVLEINLLPVELDEAATRKLAIRITPGRFVKLAVSDTGTGMDGPTAAPVSYTH